MPHGVEDDLYPDDWEQALIAGNGRQGALVYGGPAGLKVTVSHERLFLPVEEPLAPPGTGAILDELRARCLSGDYQAAADAVVARAIQEDARYETLRWIDPFVPAATLTFIPGDPPPLPWRRCVDFDTGIVTQGTEQLQQEVRVPRSRDVILVTLRGRVRGTLRLAPIDGTPPAPIAFSTGAGREGLWLSGTWPGGGYTTTAFVTAGDPAAADAAGAARPGWDGAGHLHTDVATIVLRTVVAPPRVKARRPCYTKTVNPASLLSGGHGELMGRCRLELPDDPVTERLFAAGRYAIISATGELPPNLQGVWAGSYDPPWRSGYTLDGNLATAVAGLAPTGTPELLLPVCDLLDQYLDDFRENARRLWHAGGLVVPTHLSTHGRNNHFGPRWCLTFWTGGAGWAARLYYDYYRYTQDQQFLHARALPFMREAIDFYRAVLVERDGALMLVPSYSPENSPYGPDGPQATINATHEVAVIRDLVRNLVREGAAQPGDAEVLHRLPRYEVGPDGCLREWLWPGLPDYHPHRHCSHLYGLWYEPDPALADPRLRDAAIRTVSKRLRWFGGEMAFGLVGLGLAAAALGDADLAYRALTRLHRYWRPSLVPTHNLGAIFNTDIAGGLPALVVAMLVSGEVSGGEGRVDLLPARPAAWPRGSLRGARLRGGIAVERLDWSPEQVEVTLTGGAAESLVVTVNGQQPQLASGNALRGPGGLTLVWRASKLSPPPGQELSNAVPPAAGGLRDVRRGSG